jgi:PST family polysaccharide transporter
VANPTVILRKISDMVNYLWTKLGKGGRHVAINASALLVERLVRLGVGMVVTALIARQLGPGTFGELSYGLALGNIGAGLAQVGMDGILVREFALRPDEAGVLLITSAAIRSMVAGISWILITAAFILMFQGQKGSPSVAVIAVWGLTSLQSVGTIPTFWFQANGRTWQSTRILLAIFLLAAGARLWLVAAGGNVMDFGWVSVGEYVVAGMACFWKVREMVPGSWRFSRRVALELFQASWPIWIAAAGFLGYTRFDQVLLAELANEKELGLYTAALRLTEYAYLLPMVLAAPMLGLMVSTSGNTELLRERIRRYTAASAVAAYGFVVFVWLFAPFVFGKIFGRAYHEAVPMARIQVWAAPLIAVGYARNQLLIFEGRTRFFMLTALIGVVVSIGLNLVLIPLGGGEGAAWAGVAVQGVSQVICTWWHPSLGWFSRAQLESLFTPWRILRPDLRKSAA